MYAPYTISGFQTPFDLIRLYGSGLLMEYTCAGPMACDESKVIVKENRHGEKESKKASYQEGWQEGWQEVCRSEEGCEAHREEGWSEEGARRQGLTTHRFCTAVNHVV